jgi:Tfp pilus assembly protein PilF
MREATDSFEPQRYVSARAYRHYLDALLAKGADDYATAAAELREALLYDPESPHLHTQLAEVLLKQGRVADA